MSPARLSALDASFLELEGPSAHMHVGWSAILDPPEVGELPSFEQLREHIRGRLGRAPLFRQRLLEVPGGVARPVWVDDHQFDIDAHVRRSNAVRLDDVGEEVLSQPLSRERPLWEIWVLDKLEGGGIGLVGKAHHCMVDGLGAVAFGALLADPAADPPSQGRSDEWVPTSAPGRGALLIDGITDRAREQIELVLEAARCASRPDRAREALTGTARALRALNASLRPATPVRRINEPLAAGRRLGVQCRPFEQLLTIRQRFGTTVNDVVLAVAAGAVARMLRRHRLDVQPLKALVPVNVRSPGSAREFGNRIAFVFVELPCHEPDPVRRLRLTHARMRACKEAGVPEGAEAAVRALSYTPLTIQRALARLASGPRGFNITVSNVPGPSQPLYVLGCKVREVYPATPLPEGHAVSVTLLSVAGLACFGVYADRRSLPDVDVLADELGDEIDELLARANAGEPTRHRTSPAFG